MYYGGEDTEEIQLVEEIYVDKIRGRGRPKRGKR